MKTLLLLFLLFLLPVIAVFGQDTKIDKLIEAQTKQGEQMAELAKQMAKLADKVDKLADKVDKISEQTVVNSADIKALDKRFDMLFYLMLGMLAGIFGLIGTIFWDRRAANAPIKTKVTT